MLQEKRWFTVIYMSCPVPDRRPFSITTTEYNFAVSNCLQSGCSYYDCEEV